MQWMWYLLVLIAAVAVGYFTYKSDKKKSVPQPWLTALLRALLVACTLMLLLAPFIRLKDVRTLKPYVLILQDNSESVAHNLNDDTVAFRKSLQGIIDQLANDYQVIPVAFGGHTSRDSLFTYTAATTDIAKALSSLSEYANPNIPAAVILATDGQYNIGEHPLFQNIPMRASFYAVALGDTMLQKDIKLGQVYSNDIVSAESQFHIAVDVVAQACAGYSGSITISEGGSVIAQEAITISSPRFDKSISFTLPSGKPGWRKFSVNVSKANDEHNIANNRRDFFVQVVANQKKVLLAAYAPHPDVAALKQAIGAMDQFKLTTLVSSNIPATEGYDIAILHQLPAQGNSMTAPSVPTWYIIGSNTQVNALGNQSQMFVAGNTQLQDAAPQIDPNFSLFPLSAGAGSVINSLPPLYAIQNFSAAPNTFAPIVNKNGGKPLWILKQGLKPMAATMGEGIWRWRMYEYKNTGAHKVVDDLIRQTLSFLSTNNNGNALRVEMPKYMWTDKEAATFSAYVTNAANEQINTPDVKLTIKDSTGKTKNYSFDKTGNGYTLNSGMWSAGAYSYRAVAELNGKVHEASGNFMVDGQSLEERTKGADFELLAQLAGKYKGFAITLNAMPSLYDSIKSNPHLKPVIDVQEKRGSLIEWKWYFLLVLLIATAEWLLRKWWLAH